MSEKIGVVDVGGGLRGAYAAGLLDYCLDTGIRFDLGIGVSAGSANLVSYAAEQPRRNLRFYSEYALRKEYISMGNYLHKRSFVDLDYVYGTLSNSDGEYPLDYPAIVRNPMDLMVVATEAETGNSRYFTKDNLAQDQYDICKASSAIPVICQPYYIQNVPYYDGAVSDPVPIEKAFAWGCDRVVLILTLPENTVRTPDRDKKLSARLRSRYPMSADGLEQRASRYNDSVEAARQYARQGKLVIVAPDDTCGVTTLGKDREAILRLYEKGYGDGVKITQFLERA